MTFKIALLQLETSKVYQKNLDVLVEYIKTNQDRELIVAPEVYLTAYDYDNFEEAISFYEIAMQTLLPLVSTQIVVFTIIRKEGEKIVNQAVVIHDHKVVYKQNKYRLFKLGDEHKYFEAGEKEAIEQFSINGITYALIICFELRFKELWERLEGVDIVLIPSMWGKPRKNHLEVLSQALAIMNQSFVLVCNSADEDMAKSSAIISPWGDVVMNDETEIIRETIDLKLVKKHRRLIPMH
ncbi:MAG: carbon-nitrogen hydrolase family protein [Sulfurovaceae bacterium]|nr:carbon-nitrogen hydrolase family protein [Sulfurovaceae bacterium]